MRRRTVSVPAVLVASLLLACAALFGSSWSRAQEQEVYLGTESGTLSRINLILEDLVTGPGATGSDAKRVRDVVYGDLSMTDFFNIINGAAGLSQGPPPDTTGWFALTGSRSFTSDAGARAFVQAPNGGYPEARFIAGGVLKLIGSDLVLEAYLKEYPTHRVILSRTYKARPEWYREVAHRFSDDIILYLTGEEGISRTRIAFISNQSGAKELYLIDYDGENVRQLTRDKSIALSPAWSADGSRIAFVSYRRGDPDLYQISLSTGEITVISGRPGPDMAPAFSRDGRRLAFSMTIDGNTELHVAGSDGKNPRRITNNPGIDTSPTWSPTGDYVCYTSDRSGRPNLYVADADGTNLRRLTFEGSWNDSPDWSPDGSRIVYVSQMGRDFKIWMIRVDGAEARALTGGPGSDENPKWSPDGRKILFSSNREGKRALYTMNPDGTGVRRVTFLSGDCFGTAWSARPPR